ncbi:hypothetical protein L6164_001420 [Bauhinia variegata]|uniref:Uncharacterized protein n=1 Tax=Bauhinia variegata TaxID=167791 RepID=A0ACB9Q9F2_BAUVA|nr:hypothetical protein L6164_001420 [Bauhinia variegata]
MENQKQADESSNGAPDENAARVGESRTTVKRSVPVGSLSKPSKQDSLKDDGRSGNAVTRTSGSSSSDKDLQTYASEARISSDIPGSVAKADIGITKFSDVRGSTGNDDGFDVSDLVRAPSSRLVHSPRHDNAVASSKSSDKVPKRASSAEEPDRLGKCWKGDVKARDLEGEIRFSYRERLVDPRYADEKTGSDEESLYQAGDKLVDRTKDKGNERYDREHRERLDRLDKSHGDDFVAEKPRDRSIERHGRELSIERMQERGNVRNLDRLPEKAKDERSKDDRSKLRYSDTSAEESHGDDRFHGQSLPPPPPIPPNVVPQSVGGGRHDDDADRRKEDDFRDRKREEREGLLMKVEERELPSKRPKLKKEHLPTAETGEYSSVAPPPPPSIGVSQSYDGRDRGDRKGPIIQCAGYIDESGIKIHGKEAAASKMNCRDSNPMYDREWEDEKRQS